MEKLLFGLVTAVAAALSAFNDTPDESGLEVPSGFRTQIFAENVGSARHLVVSPKETYS